MSDQLRKGDSQDDRMILDDSESFGDVSQDDGNASRKNDNQNLSGSVQAAGKDEQKTEHRDPKLISTVVSASSSTNDEGLACIMAEKGKLEYAYKDTKSKNVTADNPRRLQMGDYVKILKREGLSDELVVDNCSLVDGPREQQQEGEGPREQQAKGRQRIQIGEFVKVYKGNEILDAEVVEHCCVVQMDGEQYSIIEANQTGVNEYGIPVVVKEMRNPTSEGHLVPQVRRYVWIEPKGHSRLARVIVGNCVLLHVAGSYFEVFKVRGEDWWSYGTLTKRVQLMKLNRHAGGLPVLVRIGESALEPQTSGSPPTIKVCNVSLVSANEFQYTFKIGTPLASQAREQVAEVKRLLAARNPDVAQGDGRKPQVQVTQNLDRPGEITLASQREIVPLLKENSSVAQEDGGNPELLRNLENSSREGEASEESIRELLVKEGETKQSTEGNVERQDSEED